MGSHDKIVNLFYILDYNFSFELITSELYNNIKHFNSDGFIENLPSSKDEFFAKNNSKLEKGLKILLGVPGYVTAKTLGDSIAFLAELPAGVIVYALGFIVSEALCVLDIPDAIREKALLMGVSKGIFDMVVTSLKGAIVAPVFAVMASSFFVVEITKDIFVNPIKNIKKIIKSKITKRKRRKSHTPKVE